MEKYEQNSFDPYVRFINRRNLANSYPNLIYAFDYRLFYPVNGSIDVETGGKCITLETFALLIIPPGVGYRLIVRDEPAEFYIVNFDFDSSRSETVCRPPVIKDFFDPQKIFSRFAIPPFESLFHLSGVYEFESILREIDVARETNEFTARNIHSGFMKYLLVKASFLSETRKRTEENIQIQRVKAYVECNYSQPINNSSVAKEIGYHPYYLSSFFLLSEGITLHSYIESVRLKHAKEMLATTPKPVYEISRACGFSDSSYYIILFSGHMGMTPKGYRALYM